MRDRLLAEAWVVLLPSVKEGWGLAVLEAAAQRTPTIAYRHAGGVTESVVDGVTGYLVDDVDAMTRRTAAAAAQPLDAAAARHRGRRAGARLRLVGDGRRGGDGAAGGGRKEPAGQRSP